MATNKAQQLSAEKLDNLLISIGEARKLLIADSKKMSDEEVAQKIIQLSEFGRLVLRTLDLQK